MSVKSLTISTHYQASEAHKSGIEFNRHSLEITAFNDNVYRERLNEYSDFF